ncbi:uncharacterized protein IL334_007544 [Kwoniella shivajii]|uniref:DNA replication regulator Sld3 C-terminal domain-containing protein n=1 Tax=Kwoniella shivajii TaxID=564305 RepID=A0ABZ1D9S3_9TREE|nr:hypothetical protein IL334_007544 [Kwoniella shivajii]
MTTLVESPLPLVWSSHSLPGPPFSLDLICPLVLPSKPLEAGSDWPFQIAGSSSTSSETVESFTLSPLAGFTVDLLRLSPTSPSSDASPPNNTLGDVIRPFLRSLPQIETRHRKVIFPLLCTSSGSSVSELLDEGELDVIKFALEIRLGSRQALDEGIMPSPKKLSDELEKRETLLQIILLLMYTIYAPSKPQSKKRKRVKHSHRAEPDSPINVNPTEDPETALELLVDRLSVWQAVSELGLSLDPVSKDSRAKGKSKTDENGIAVLLGKFWKSVMVPYFLPKRPELCSVFHLKVFGHPLPPKLLPLPITATKKPRKPKLTRAMPSRDSLIPPPHSHFERPRSVSNDDGRSLSLSRVSSRGGSRAPSETGSRNSPPRESHSMKQTLSRTNTDNHTLAKIGGLERSRSRSIDPLTRSESLSRSISFGVDSNSSRSKKGSLLRNPSGKDLFKSREVGLMRRTTSSRRPDSFSREDSQNQSQTGRFGLLGRKTSGGKESSQRRNSEESQKPNTLILATPSKPRHNNFFRPSQSQQFSSSFNSWIPPTPIREEPTSTPRPNFIAETPIAPGRIATKESLPLGGIDDDEDEGGESDDPLGELWELTDDEDVGQEREDRVLDTPMK